MTKCAIKYKRKNLWFGVEGGHKVKLYWNYEVSERKIMKEGRGRKDIVWIKKPMNVREKLNVSWTNLWINKSEVSEGVVGWIVYIVEFCNKS